MAHRLIFSGHKISYGRLKVLSRGETIVATWRRDLVNTPHAKRIACEGNYITVAGQTKHGFYVDLHWYSSTTGSEDPADYDMLP